MRWRVPAATFSRVPAVLVKLGSLDVRRTTGLRPYLDPVPDPRARRGRWYSLTAILLVCACAVVRRARSLDELAEWWGLLTESAFEIWRVGCSGGSLGWV
ncbi:transposase family protein [Streptomyces sp. NBC_01476]